MKPAADARNLPRGTGISVGFFNLGCPKNLVDSEHMAAVLLSEGFVLAPRVEEAEVVVVNTCAFISDALEESLEAAAQAVALKNSGRCRAVVMAGCLPQRGGRRLWKTMPDIDAFVGIDEIDSMGAIVRGALGRRRIFAVPPDARRVLETPGRKVFFTGGPVAYVKIADGCDHKCGFCVIPSIRGKYRSRPARAIVAEAEDLLARGLRELVLVSQDTTLYGCDLPRGGELPGLLRELGGIGGRFWIRLLYGHPAHVTMPLIEAVRDIPQVCKYLDLPVQHSHPAMLRAMRRGDGGLFKVAEMPAFLRSQIPGLTLRTTCLTGYPGETPSRFRHLLAYVEESRFDRLGVFAYSPQSGTHACGLPGQVAGRTAEARRARLMELQRHIVRDINGKLRGLREEILILRKTAGSEAGWTGRSARHAPDIDGEVRVRGLPAGRDWTGEFVQARYTAVRGYDMEADYAGKGAK